MAFDYKKEYKEFYMPKNKPGIIEIPKMNYIAVRGKGNPNEENGEYKSSIGLLYGIAFTIKMSYKGTHKIEGFFEYVVPPLEGLWWQENTEGLDYARKEDMHSIADTYYQIALFRRQHTCILIGQRGSFFEVGKGINNLFGHTVYILCNLKIFDTTLRLRSVISIHRNPDGSHGIFFYSTFHNFFLFVFLIKPFRL